MQPRHAGKGKHKLKKLAKWLGNEYPSARGSLLEGLDEMYTINALGFPKPYGPCQELEGSCNGRQVGWLGIDGYGKKV